MKTKTVVRATSMAAIFYFVLGVVCQPARGQGEVKFRLIHETAIVVPAMVNGAGPFDFILDTGTTTTLLDADVARRLSLRPIDRTLLHTVAGTQALVRSSISTLTIGPAAANHLEALITDLGELKKLDSRIGGIVGENFLLQLNYLIDYRRHVLSFEVTDEIRKRASGERIPFEVRDQKMLFAAETHFESQNKLLLSLDSGASSVVLFHRGSLAVNSEMQALKVSTANGIGHVRLAQIRALRIGSQTLRDVSAALPLSSPANSQPVEDGLLPASLFHVLYINNREAFAVFNPRVESATVVRGRDVPAIDAAISPAGARAQAGESDNVVVQWNVAALQGVRDSHIGPPMVARALAIVHTCIFDAWAAYDKKAVGTQFGDKLRRPKRERTLANKNEAISFAAYRALVDLFASDKASVFDPLMASLGYDPNNLTINPETPAGIGNVACSAVLAFRHGDGSNQLGDLHPGAYSDWTGYTSVNPASTVPVNPALVLDPNHWQALTYDDGATAPTPHIITQSFVGAQWYRVVPFAMTSPDQFRPFVARFGPALYGSETYLQQSKDLIAISANLTDEQKMIAEYWANGPRTELPPGHWALFGEFVSRRDNHSVDDAAKMFFALTNAIFDASIASWDAKRAFDSVRPIQAIPYLFHGQQITAWRPFRGTQTFDGSLWIPYQTTTFPTPPFPEYISGHSTFSAAGAQILKLFTDSDKFGDSVTFPAGSSNTEPGLTPKQEVTLCWPTFTDAANQAGISRRYGGIHFELADLVGRATGRLVADQAWEKALSFINGRRDRDEDEDSKDDRD